MTLETFFTRLARHGSAPRSDWPFGEDPESYGLVVKDDRLLPAGRFDPLVPGAIQQALSRQAASWLQRLDVHPVIGSTNAELMAEAQQRSVDGCVSMAELQLRGRGRRGRRWSSPFGANLAISIGVALDRPASALGGVSLVVGLAVLDVLEALEVSDLSLKWPNDILLGDAKLGGILIEMVRRNGIELVVGIGLNVVLPEPIRAVLPPGVADLSHTTPLPSRSFLAGRVISSVTQFVHEFERMGFAPFRPAFDARHRYRGRHCRVLQGDRSIQGIVTGVGDDGELILQTSEGLRTFHGGEVSLRADG